MTEFRRLYADAANSHFAGTVLIPDQARDAWFGDQWFTFRSKDLPRGVNIVHKAQAGHIDLVFANAEVTVLIAALDGAKLPDGMSCVQTGKSASVRTIVKPISDWSSSSSSMNILESAFGVIDTLHALATANRHAFVNVTNSLR